jgi:hypothetical protein
MIILLFIFNINQAVQGNSPDTIKIQKQFFLEKLSFGIGYSGGLCYSSDDLAEPSSSPGLDWPFYWLNSVNISVSYPLGETKKVEIKSGYGWWPKLNNRKGFSMYLPNQDTLIYYSYVETSQWNLSMLFISLILQLNPTFRVGITSDYCIAKTEEKLNLYDGEDWFVDTTANVQRNCIGAGIFCGWQGSSFFGSSKFKPYLKIQLGWAKEYSNNSPWEWDDRLTVGLSGVFIGVKFEIGDY